MECQSTLPKAYRYDAFISYRHLPLDMAVAARLQELLENYRPPKNVEGLDRRRIERVFRDTSELPTSGDLGNDIREALKSSRFLIVICSEHIQESRWCMEEINLFKEYHGGRTDHILPLLVSGDPSYVFPRQLLLERRTQTRKDGSQYEYDAVIEPLCADVRADTVSKSLRRLKTEFLRIAAPILGCGFDTLYQRHLRRKKRRTITALASSLGLLTGVLLLVSLFAYRTWLSERAYRETLSENYLLQGSEHALADHPQQALLYFAQALSASPEQLPAAYAGAALLLQEYYWPVAEQEIPGTVLDSGYCPYSWAMGEVGEQYYLRAAMPAIEVCDAQGGILRQIQVEDGSYATFLTQSAGQWSFRLTGQDDLSDERFLLYDPAADRVRYVEKPQDASRLYDPESDIFSQFSIAAVGEDRAVVTGAGLVRLMEIDQQGNAQTVCTADLADAFPLMEKAQTVSAINDLWVSDDCALLAVRHLNSVAIYETEGLVLCGTIDTGVYSISHVAFSAHNTLALACGNPYSLGGSHINPGGFFGVYRTNGQVIYQSQPDQENIFLGVDFCQENEQLLLTWSQSMAAVFSLEEERFITAPVYVPNISAACFYGSGSICVSAAVRAIETGAADSSLIQYRYIALPQYTACLEEGEGEIHVLYSSQRKTVYGPEGMTLSCDGFSLEMYSGEGELLASRELPVPVAAPIIALSEDGSCVYVGDTAIYSGLLTAQVDFSNETIGEFTSGDTDGSTVLNLWSLGENGAAETSSREIMVFRPDGERIFSAVPKHSSLPVGVVTDPLQRYLALCLEETQTEQGVMRYEQNSYIEVWDIASGILIADYAVPGRALDAMAITQEGALIWQAGGTTYSRMIPSAPPDRSAQEFLSSLCSLSLNDRQEDVSKTPAQDDLPEGNWYTALGGWQEVSFPKAAEESLSAVIAGLSGSEQAGSLQWIDQCDALWQSLAAGELAYTVPEVDLLFETYSVLASNSGRIESVGYGLETYFDLISRAMEESDAVVDSSLVSYVLPILCETKVFDSLVAEEFLRMAAQNQADIQRTDALMAQETDETALFMWEEIDRPVLELTSYQLKAWAACLSGGQAQQAWLETVEFCLDYDAILYPLGDAYAAACLLQGDGAGAAELMNQVLSLQTLGMSQEELTFFEDYFSEHLESLEIMLYRGLIDPAAAGEYLELLHARFGLEVTEVGAQAQESGIRLGDFIPMINGRRVTCLPQAKRLLQQEDAQYTIQRDGSSLTLPVCGGVTYQFLCTLS